METTTMPYTKTCIGEAPTPKMCAVCGCVQRKVMPRCRGQTWRPFISQPTPDPQTPKCLGHNKCSVSIVAIVADRVGEAENSKK